MVSHAQARRVQLLAAALAVLASCSQSGEQRVHVSGAATPTLLAAGATLVQDYGAFQIVKAPAAALAALPDGAAVPLDGRILLNAGAFDPEDVRLLSARQLAVRPSGRTLNLVQFAGPVRAEWYDALAATGVRIVAYVPNDAYLVYGDAAAVTALSALSKASPSFRWAGAYLDSDKLHPATRTVDTGAWSIQLVEDPEANALTLLTVALHEKGPTRVSAELGYLNLVVRCDAAALASIAAHPEVVSIQPWVEPKPSGERQAMIVSGNVIGNLPSGPGYLTWLASKGFTQAQFSASGFGVDVSDSGVDNGNAAAPNHFALYVEGDVANSSRLAYARLEGTPGAGSTIQGCDGHGNLNAHVVGGYASLGDAIHADAAGYRYGMGIAPFVKVGSSVLFDPGFTNPDYEDLQSRAWAGGMRVSTNSWGASVSGTYTTDSQRYDALVRDAAPAGSALPLAGNQGMSILFAAGNSGSSAGTIDSPSSAKNVITVGGTEGVQPFGAADQCGVADAQADSFNDIATFSSRGPTADGRKKPDLVAPATHISGGVAQAAGQRADPPAVATGSVLGCFDASGVCAGPGGSDFFPTTQQWYTASSGTSLSTPAVAGAAALVRQYFLNAGLAAPSPAMTKAYLMNSARYLTGASANDTLPSNSQGLGLLDLGMAFDGVTRILVDEEPANLLSATGETRTLEGSISDPGIPFRVTLAWTDAPGSTTGAAYNNDLHLSVTIGGNTYLGNVFSGPNSVTGGAADTRNNVESVFLPAGVSGPFSITVTAANINSDGVPNVGGPLDQDYALVIYGACTTPPPGTPTDATAAATAPNEVTVSWTDVGATEYRIYRSSTAGGPYTRVGTTAGSPYVDTTVSGGATYYYVVRSAACSESPSSNEASVVATGVCTIPPAFAGAQSAVSNGAATCGNTVSWSAATPVCGGTVTYEVHRSTSAGFTPGRANRIATGVTGTSFMDDLNLESGTSYHYVVRATELSDAANTDANTVERSVVTHGAVGLAYFDDFDGNRPPNASAYWRSDSTYVIPVSGCRFQSATTAYRFGQNSATCPGLYANNLLPTLSLGGDGSVDAAVNGFVIGPNATMTFNHAYNLENGFDGAWLAYSTTSATGPWTRVEDSVSATAPYISAGGYSGNLAAAGGRVWMNINTPVNGSLTPVTVNLDALAGQTVWFAWKFRTDSSVVREGYYLDDVRLQSFGACTPFVPPPGPPAAFSVSLPATTGAGVPVAVTLTAVDALGMTATGYAGSANLASSDPLAILPGPVTFTAGTATANVEFRTLGAQTLAIADATDPGVTGDGALSVTPGEPARLAFGVVPPTATAGSSLAPAVTVRIEDAFGNLTSATDAVTVALGSNPGGDTLGGTLTVNAVAGVATFPDLVLQRAAAGYTLVASAATYTGASSAAIEIVPAAAATLQFGQQPGGAVAGDAIAPTPTVEIRDAYGNLVTGSTATVTVSLATHPSAGTLGGTASVDAVAGVATFPDLWIDRVGTGYQLAAASAGLGGITSDAFDVSHAVADHLAFVQQPSDVVAGDPLTPALSVEVLDRFENRATGYVGNVSLAIGVNPTASALTGATAATVIFGVATFADVSVQVAGVGYALTAASGALGGAVSTTFDVLPGPVTLLVFAAQPGGSFAGAPIAGAPAVLFVDAYGNRQPDATGAVTIALGANPGGDTPTGTLTVNAVAGAATFTDLVLQRAADGYTLVATAGALAAQSAAFDVHAAAPAALQFVTAPASTPAGAPLAPPPAVRVRDAYGNTVTTSSATVTLALGSNPSSGTLSGTTAVAATNGVATFPALAIDRVGAGYSLAATSAGVTPADSGAFDVGAGSPATVVFLTQPTDLVAGATLPALTVEIRDAWGNRTSATSDVVVGFATAPGAASLSGTRRVTAAAGQATFSDLSVDRVGVGYALSATVDGLPLAVTSSFDVTPGPAVSIRIQGLAPSVAKGTATTYDLVALDAEGNVATGYAGTVTVATSDGAAAVASPVTFVAGVATGVSITFNTGGAQGITVTDTGAPSITGSAATVVVAQPEAPSDSGGCGCGTGSVGEAALLLALAGLWRAAVAPRRRRAA